MTIQHLRSSTANKRPTPAAMSDGQIAVNTNTASPGLFFKDSAGALIKIGPVHVGTTAPNASPASGGETGNTVGEQWLDTTGGTYVFKVWDGSAWRSESGTFVDVNGDVMTGALGIIAGSAGSPGLYFSGDTNTGIYSPGADQVAISTGGSPRVTVTSTGVGIGATTPNATLSVSSGSVGLMAELNSTNANGGYFSLLTSNSPYGDIGTAAQCVGGSASDFCLNGRGSCSLVLGINNTERARIDSSGRLLVGTSSARSNFYNDTNSARFQVEGADNDSAAIAVVQNFNGNTLGGQLILAKSNLASVGSNTLVAAGDRCGTISFQGNDGTQFVEAALIRAEVDGTPGANDMPGRLVFSTTADGASSPTERMRISSTGLTGLFASNGCFDLCSAAAAGTSVSYLYGRHSATGQNTGTNSFVVWTNGNVQNTNNSYGAISDAKLKENIVDATSQWSDIKALQVRKYNFKEGQTHTQIGLVAQEVELVSPGLVSESPDRDAEGNDLGTVTKSVNYSVLYMKAVKALQEAMERIEQLESEMAEVKAQLS